MAAMASLGQQNLAKPLNAKPLLKAGTHTFLSVRHHPRVAHVRQGKLPRPTLGSKLFEPKNRKQARKVSARIKNGGGSLKLGSNKKKNGPLVCFP